MASIANANAVYYKDNNGQVYQISDGAKRYLTTRDGTYSSPDDDNYKAGSAYFNDNYDGTIDIYWRISRSYNGDYSGVYGYIISDATFDAFNNVKSYEVLNYNTNSDNTEQPTLDCINYRYKNVLRLKIPNYQGSYPSTSFFDITIHAVIDVTKADNII